MSPAAELLESHIDRLQLSQALVARLTGLPASHVSGLVRGKLHIPRHPKFIQQIADGLALSDSQVSEFRTAIELSPRALTLDPWANREIFLLVDVLQDRVSMLDGNCARFIRAQIVACCNQKTGPEPMQPF